MITVIIIAIIIAILYFVAKVAIKGNSQNSEVNQAPQPANIEKNDVQYKKTSPEEMKAAKEKHIQNQKQNANKEQESQEVQIPSNADGYFYHEMVGMYNLGVTPSEFGIYEGYAIAEKNNPHDKFAVGIHRSKDGKLVGYIPMESRGESNEGIHGAISDIGGRAKAVIKITGSAQRSYGSVYIKTN